MIWHIDAELIALTFVSVLLYDMSKNNPLKSRRDHLFHLISIATFLVITVDILMILFSVLTIDGWIYQLITITEMVLFPFLTLSWFFYACATLYKGHRIQMKCVIPAVIPFAICTAVILSNPFTQVMLSSSPPFEAYTSFGFSLLLGCCSFYSLLTIFMTIHHHPFIRVSKAIVICFFPAIVTFAFFAQRLFSGYLFVGWACAISLFITYLFLQNRKMSVDVLTGAQSRASLLKRLKQIEKGKNNGYLIVVSLDDFKFVNQTFGQSNSDAILKNVSTYLSVLVADRIIYRYNGDEFALVLTKQQSTRVNFIVSTILERFNTMWEYNAIAFMLSASIGVVQFPNNAQTAEELITAADFAIYQAKISGKRQAVCFDDQVMLKLSRRHAVEGALKQAIAHDGFEVYYQPIYNLHDGRFEYAEALLRLTDEHLGVISPSEFIPIAENSGLIVEITYIVFAKVIDFIKQMKKTSRPLNAIAINLSAVNFMQKDISQRILQLISESGINPSEIRLELTEGILIDSFNNVKDVMNQLAEHGVLFALDDFGEGYSNISYLLNLPFVSVKLDRSIIHAHMQNTLLLDSVITMLQKMGKKVVAEGVETAEQSEILKKLSCDYIQGFWYALPMPKDKMMEMLSNT